MTTTRIITPPTVEPVTLEQAKVHLREDLSDAGNDARINTLIAVGRQAAEHRTARAVMLQTIELTLDAFTACIELHNPPVIAVTSVTYTDTDGASVVLDPSAYTLDNSSEPARLVPAYGTTWPATQASVNAVRIRYTAGYSGSADAAVARAAVPDALKQWVLLAVGDMYEYGTASAEKPAVRHDFVDGLLDAYRVWSL